MSLQQRPNSPSAQAADLDAGRPASEHPISPLRNVDEYGGHAMPFGGDELFNFDNHDFMGLNPYFDPFLPYTGQTEPLVPNEVIQSASSPRGGFIDNANQQYQQYTLNAENMNPVYPTLDGVNNTAPPLPELFQEPNWDPLQEFNNFCDVSGFDLDQQLPDETAYVANGEGVSFPALESPAYDASAEVDHDLIEGNEDDNLDDLDDLDDLDGHDGHDDYADHDDDDDDADHDNELDGDHEDEDEHDHDHDDADTPSDQDDEEEQDTTNQQVTVPPHIFTAATIANDASLDMAQRCQLLQNMSADSVLRLGQHFGLGLDQIPPQSSASAANAVASSSTAPSTALIPHPSYSARPDPQGPLTEANYYPLVPDESRPTHPNDRRPIYPAFAGRFSTSSEARAYRRRVRLVAKSDAPDIERVKRYGRLYWVRRIYEAMIDISLIMDGGKSIHRQRFTRSTAFEPADLEAAAHQVFDAALAVHERGWVRPLVYHKRVVRGKLSDLSERSVESRLERICVCLRHKKATVDDALRGGLTLALLCDNPEARGFTKASNNMGNQKRGERLKAAKEVEIKDKPPKDKPTKSKAAKGKVAKGKAVKGKAAQQQEEQQSERSG